MLVVRARLLDYSEDIGGYIVYIFLNLDYNGYQESPYIMCTRYPNWNSPTLKIGDTGFLSYKEVFAGKTEWWDGQAFHKYKYTDSVFEKFVFDHPKPEIMLLMHHENFSFLINMLLGEKLQEAFDKKQNDLSSFVWKGRKIEVDGKFVQVEKRLIDCTIDELLGFYNHCKSMLYNQSEDDPGRYVLLKITKDQRLRCNAELFLRWIESEKGVPRFKFLELINNILAQNKGIDPKEVFIEAIANPCPEEFTGIPLSLIIDGCLDRLSKFNKKHLTLTFILKQGVWFTSAESKELTVKDENGNVRDRMDVVRENLKLPSTIKLYATPKGLSYTQLRALINLKSKKYSDLTTEQLTLLRDRILFSLEIDVNKHIEQWETREEQIQKVLESKGYTINDSE